MVTEADRHLCSPAQLEYYLDVVFDAFGPERIMIGSDWPVCTLAAGYDRTMAVVEDYVARLPVSAREAVLGGTAARFYGI
jgi:L-fuconolactonase